jgi:hypothetical protein
MSDELDRRLSAADPVDPATLPGASETNQALDRLSALRARRSRRLSFSKPTWVLGTTSALAAAAIVAVLLFTAAATPTPSYAVTRHSDGTVTVRLASPAAVQALNRKLQLMGVPARISLAYAAASMAANGCGAKAASSLESFSFNSRAIPVGHVLVLTADQRLHFLYARAVAMKMSQVVIGPPVLQRLRLLSTHPGTIVLPKLLRFRLSRVGISFPVLQMVLRNRVLFSHLPAGVRNRLLRLRVFGRASTISLPKLLMLRTMTLRGRLVARPLALAYAQGLAAGPVPSGSNRAIKLICAKRTALARQAQH